MTTSEIRKKLKEKRNALTSQEIKEQSIKICNNFFTLSFANEKLNYFIYNSIKNEVDTSYIIGKLKESKKVISYPLTIKEEMVAVLLQGEEWEVGDFGIKVPKRYEIVENIDVAIIPMLACDNNLNRIGYGKGYYDKFLSKTSCIKVGVCYDFQVIKDITPNEFDVPLDYIVTPTKIITKWKNLLHFAEDFIFYKLVKNQLIGLFLEFNNFLTTHIFS